MPIFSSGTPDIAAIATSQEVGVTRYSKFLLDCLRDLPIAGKKACDFGSGTGVIGIGLFELGASEVVFVEPYETAQALTVRNAELFLPNNQTWSLIANVDELPKSSWGTFECMVSNPSSLPTTQTNNNSGQFYAGGPLGLDMINDMIEASKRLLTPGGTLYFLLTTLSDYKTVLRSIGKDFSHVEVCNVVQFDFRPHYQDHEEYWERLREKNKVFFFSNGSQRVELVFFVRAVI
ncbi:MAG: methyltransferase [Pseudomonadota bacterium]